LPLSLAPQARSYELDFDSGPKGKLLGTLTLKEALNMQLSREKPWSAKAKARQWTGAWMAEAEPFPAWFRECSLPLTKHRATGKRVNLRPRFLVVLRPLAEGDGLRIATQHD